MKEPIRFAGLDLHTDELSASNSSLALCAGVECENGALKPSFLSYTDMNFQTVQNSLGNFVPVTLVYIHESASYKNYICSFQDDDALLFGVYRLSDNGAYTWSRIPTIECNSNKSVQIQHVGNTLIFNISGVIRYILFKDGSYKYLGEKPPFIKLQFGTTQQITHGDLDADLWEDLKTSKEVSVPKKVFFRHDKAGVDKASNLLEEYREETDVFTLRIKQENRTEITEAVKAFVNKANNFLAKEGCFYAPFMVRYAYRMYDGKTLIMHSSPVYIPVSDNGISQYDVRVVNYQTYLGDNNVPVSGLVTAYDNIVVDLADNSGGSEDKNGGLCLLYLPGNVKLRCRIMDYDNYSLLQNNWADIIKSIDIFITEPLVDWDQAEMIKEIDISDPTYTLAGGDFTSIYLTDSQIPLFAADSKQRRPTHSFKIPRYSNPEHNERVRNSSVFFKLHSFNLKKDSLSSYMTDIPYNKGVLSTITAQEQMVDDYKSHNKITGNKIFTYNHRFHVGDVTEHLFEGFDTDIQVPYWATVDASSGIDYASLNMIRPYQMTVQLSTEDGTKYVQIKTTDYSWQYLCKVMPTYFFYPDARAVGMTIKTDVGVLNIPLTECPGLNGAAWFGFPNNLTLETTAKYEGTSSTSVYMPSKLYVAPVDNPFVFEPSGIMTVGVGSILGIAVATRAISPGQYGTFPLIVFCSDGIWMFSVDKEGRYADPSYLSSEVVSKPDSITQLDQSVVFATSRAMNKLAADQVQDFTLPLDGSPFSADDLPRLNDWLKDNTNWKSLIDSNSGNPIDAIINSKVLYDVVNYRLLFVPDTASIDNQIVYVYNIATGLWSTMLVPAIKSIINGFPHPHVVLKNGTTVRLDKKQDISDNQTSHYGLIVTRALKFDGVHKTIKAFDQSHSMSKGAMMFIYGSNNLRKWHYVGCSSQPRDSYLPGSTWRYFKLALFLDMKAAEKFYCTHLEIVEKYNKL